MLAIGLLLAGAGPAQALTLGFEEFVHGEFIDASQGVVITTENFHPLPYHPDQAVAFDTLRTPTSDPDLEQRDGWSTGNLAAQNVRLGNIMIIQENNFCENMICVDPDDEAHNAAGTITLDYSAIGTFETFAFDLVDVEGMNSEDGSVEFLLNGASVNYFDFDTFLSLGQGVVWGNNSANHIDLGNVGAFDTVVITLGGSGGVDNVMTSEVPEPSTLVLCSLGLAGITAVGRRRQR
jgi:hypothetical protein